ncbi:MAG TPA: YbdD/YjiX family protein [Casimicrobiaceae bacterium]|nr:YbdD/YjiX family protein [Casimicrobiaceae bacterium]
MRLKTREAPPAARAVDANDLQAEATAGFRERLVELRRACRQLIGIPDYESYLTHMAERHPGEPVLSRREFCARAIDRKYGKGGPRCC